MERKNRQILSRGQKYKQKAARTHGATEVVFDKDSRLEYLTGFHKRKLERQKKAQEFAKEQERLARVEERRKQREQRRSEMEQQLESARAAMAGSLDSDGDAGEEDSWHGFSDSEEGVRPILKRHQDVYDDATVEIETLEPNDNFAYLARMNNVALERSEKVLDDSIDRAKKYAEFLGVADKPKQKKKKFRYLTKAERRTNQRKATSNKRRK